MKINIGLLNRISIILIITYILLYPFLASVIVESLLFIGLLLLFITVILRNNIRLYLHDYALFSFFFFYTIGLLYTSDFTKGFKYFLSFAVAIIIKILIQNSKIDVKFLLSLIQKFVILFSLTIILHPIFPNLISSIRDYFTKDPSLIVENYLNQNNYVFGGIFADRAVAAFYGSITVFLGIYYISIKKYYRTIIYLTIGLLAIALTGKRGPFVAAIFASLFTYIMYNRIAAKKILYTLLIATVLIVVTFYIFKNTEFGYPFYERFFNNDNFLTNRDDIYIRLIQDIKIKPLIGFGTGSTDKDLGIAGHNIYLNIFRENGLIGLFLFLFFIFLLFIDIFYKKQIKIDYLVFYMVFVYFIIYGITGNPMYDNYILLFTFLSIGLVQQKGYIYEKNRHYNIS